MSLLRRSVELGLGALMLTREAVEELLGQPEDDVIEVDQRRELAEELLAKGRQLREELSLTIRREVDEALARSGLVRRAEYEALEARVAALEARLAGDPGIESASDL